MNVVERAVVDAKIRCIAKEIVIGGGLRSFRIARHKIDAMLVFSQFLGCYLLDLTY